MYCWKEEHEGEIDAVVDNDIVHEDKEGEDHEPKEFCATNSGEDVAESNNIEVALIIVRMSSRILLIN